MVPTSVLYALLGFTSMIVTMIARAAMLDLIKTKPGPLDASRAPLGPINQAADLRQRSAVFRVPREHTQICLSTIIIGLMHRAQGALLVCIPPQGLVYAPHAPLAYSPPHFRRKIAQAALLAGSAMPRALHSALVVQQHLIRIIPGLRRASAARLGSYLLLGLHLAVVNVLLGRMSPQQPAPRAPWEHTRHTWVHRSATTVLQEHIRQPLVQERAPVAQSIISKLLAAQLRARDALQANISTF